jgi:hypothetical protein
MTTTVRTHVVTGRRDPAREDALPAVAERAHAVVAVPARRREPPRWPTLVGELARAFAWARLLG